MTAQAHDHASRHDPVYDHLHTTPTFVELRRRYRGFVFPATVAFLSWYLLYVVMSMWAHDFMSQDVVGNINVGLVFGLLQFVTTFFLAWLYSRFSTARLDPLARELDEEYNRERREARPMSTQALTTLLFLSVVALTIGITFWASRQTSGTADFYAGGRSFSGFQNGLAISGDYMSAASFLGISGAIALAGYDGFLYSIGFLVAWLVALLLVAEMLRNSGRYTMADQLAFRMRQRPVRTAAATSTVVVSIFYLLAQMVGAGTLVALLLGVENQAVKNFVIFGVGALMIFYVTVGGMKGTTWVQIVKAVLLMAGSALIVVLVLAKFDFNLSDLLGTAASNSGQGQAFLEPGLKYGVSTTSKLDFLSLGIALVLGTAGLPHILIRFYTVPTSRDARKSVLWAIGLIGTFYLFTLVLGFGAAALLSGDEAEQVATSKGNLASPLLAEAVGGGAGSTGGAVLLALISAVAFATILRGGGGPDAHLVGVGGARHLQQRDQEGPGVGEGRDPDDPDRGRRDRPDRDRARDPRAEPQHRLPGGAGVRGRGVGQPAGDRLQHVLAALQHPRRRVEHLRRPRVVADPGVLLPGDVGQGPRPGHRREPVAAARQHRHLVVPAGEPGPGLDPARLLLRLARQRDVEGARRDRPLHRARGPRAHRRRRRAGRHPLTARPRTRAALPRGRVVRARFRR